MLHTSGDLEASVDCQAEKDFQFVFRLNRDSLVCPTFPPQLLACNRFAARPTVPIRSSLFLKEFECDATFRRYSKNLTVVLIEDDNDTTIRSFNPFNSFNPLETFSSIVFRSFLRWGAHYRCSKKVPRSRRTVTKNFLIYDPILRLAEHVQ